MQHSRSPGSAKAFDLPGEHFLEAHVVGAGVSNEVSGREQRPRASPVDWSGSAHILRGDVWASAGAAALPAKNSVPAGAQRLPRNRSADDNDGVRLLRGDAAGECRQAVRDSRIRVTSALSSQPRRRPRDRPGSFLHDGTDDHEVGPRRSERRAPGPVVRMRHPRTGGAAARPPGRPNHAVETGCSPRCPVGGKPLASRSAWRGGMRGRQLGLSAGRGASGSPTRRSSRARHR